MRRKTKRNSKSRSSLKNTTFFSNLSTCSDKTLSNKKKELTNAINYIDENYEKIDLVDSLFGGIVSIEDALYEYQSGVDIINSEVYSRKHKNVTNIIPGYGGISKRSRSSRACSGSGGGISWGVKIC